MTLGHCLFVSAALFALGVFGLVTRRNLIAVLMALELMVNAALINFVAFAHFRGGGRSFDATAGAVFPLFVMAVAACEVALALGLVMALRRSKKSIETEALQALHD